jgi:hypothetical protein
MGRLRCPLVGTNAVKSDINFEGDLGYQDQLINIPFLGIDY